MGLRKLSPSSLKEFVLLSWLIPGGLAVCASVMAFFAIGWVDHHNAVSRTVAELRDKGKVAARRLSGEILLGASGSVKSVSKLLEQDLEVESISVTQTRPECLISETETCSIQNGPGVTVYQPVKALLQPYYVQLNGKAPSYWGSLKPTLLLWSTLPILLLLGMGLFFQRLYLKRYIVRPIESLVETTLRQSEPPAHWPKELRTIATSLSESFEARDQAVFGQLARGVIHDIKTLLHSMVTATELVQEQPEGSPKRALRIESLLRATSTNLPKMRHIIEQTLDGSREIPVQPRTHDIAVTIQNALEVSRDLAETRQVTVDYSGPDTLFLSHDPVQLERALVNIIKNGIEALEAKEDGERLVRVFLDEEHDSGALITIEDSGPGLPDSPGLVFKPLRSKKLHGSGLGLMISKKIIESHSGSITAGRSDTLSGALFEISLPLSSRAGVTV